MRPEPLDIVILAAEWQPRALLRAQLIEEGFEVVATDAWPMTRHHLRTGSKPRLAIVDLKSLPDPERVLDDLRVLMKPDRVLVVSAAGTISRPDIERRGFHALPRPVVIDDVVGAVRQLIRQVSALE